MVVLYSPWCQKFPLLQEKKFSEAERLAEEARQAARDAHLRAEEALAKQQAADEAQRRAQALQRKHDEEAHRLQELRQKAGPYLRQPSNMGSLNADDKKAHVLHVSLRRVPSSEAGLSENFMGRFTEKEGTETSARSA